MSLQVGYPHDRCSREPRPLKAREIWSIAEHVRQQSLPRRPSPCVDLERLVRVARKILVNGIEIVIHWDLDRSVRDGKGREALGVTEVDPALPGVLLISLNAELIAERDYLRRSTLAHELGHALFDGPAMLRRAGQPAFAMVTPDEDHLAKPARGRGGIDWREFRANEFMGALLAPRALLHRELVRRTIVLGLPLRDAGEDPAGASDRRGSGPGRGIALRLGRAVRRVGLVHRIPPAPLQAGPIGQRYGSPLPLHVVHLTLKRKEEEACRCRRTLVSHRRCGNALEHAVERHRGLCARRDVATLGVCRRRAGGDERNRRRRRSSHPRHAAPQRPTTAAADQPAGDIPVHRLTPHVMAEPCPRIAIAIALARWWSILFNASSAASDKAGLDRAMRPSRTMHSSSATGDTASITSSDGSSRNRRAIIGRASILPICPRAHVADLATAWFRSSRRSIITAISSGRRQAQR